MQLHSFGLVPRFHCEIPVLRKLNWLPILRIQVIVNALFNLGRRQQFYIYWKKKPYCWILLIQAIIDQFCCSILGLQLIKPYVYGLEPRSLAHCQWLHLSVRLWNPLEGLSLGPYLGRKLVGWDAEECLRCCCPMALECSAQRGPPAFIIDLF